MNTATPEGGLMSHGTRTSCATAFPRSWGQINTHLSSHMFDKTPIFAERYVFMPRIARCEAVTNRMDETIKFGCKVMMKQNCAMISENIEHASNKLASQKFHSYMLVFVVAFARLSGIAKI